MAVSEKTVDFEAIERDKENIQSLPGGRSAKKLVELYSQSPVHKTWTRTAEGDTGRVNECIRAEYEAEVQKIGESDDPLDVFDRYVQWTLDAYPSAQATAQSQLHTLLERATKAFIGSAQYKNDLRYLKLWLHYIHFFADAPRETYIFLSRHGIGHSLALFYEEYAAWLEGAGKFCQAEEVYRAGMEREARPVQRLQRKFKEFEARAGRRAQEDLDEASSPALPTARPALASKADPFGSAAAPAPQQSRAGNSASSRPAKSKIEVFCDADAQPSALGSHDGASRGWETIDSLAARKKENTIEAKPWVGQTLKAGGNKTTASELIVFRDASQSQSQSLVNKVAVVPSKSQISVHPQTGKKECVFVHLAVIYPTPDEAGTELSFEEVIAANRGWLDSDWSEQGTKGESLVGEPAGQVLNEAFVEPRQAALAETVAAAAVDEDRIMYDENGAVKQEPRARAAGRKKKMMEVNETQIIKAKLDSPLGPKLRKKSTSEATMTIHTRAATDDIYDIFNAPLKAEGEQGQEEESAFDDFYETDDDYTVDGTSRVVVDAGEQDTTDAESNGTSRFVGDGADEEQQDDASLDGPSVSAWSDFSTLKHIPSLGREDKATTAEDGEEEADVDDASVDAAAEETSHGLTDQDSQEDVLAEQAPRTRTIYIPLPPEDCEVPTGPYKDAAEAANNRLPFMTPITERTEYSMDVEAEFRKRQSKTPSREGLDLGSLESRLVEIVEEQAVLKPAVVEEEEQAVSKLVVVEEEEEQAVSKPAVVEEEEEQAVSKLVVVEEEEEQAASKPVVVEEEQAVSKPVVVEEEEQAASKPVVVKEQAPLSRRALAQSKPAKGPIVTEKQCNPVDDGIRQEILSKTHPPLASCAGFFDHRPGKHEGGAEIRRFAKAMARASKGGDKTPAEIAVGFEDSATTWRVKREIGAGAYAPVYLVERQGEDEADTGTEGGVCSSRRGRLEALKMEQPPTAWEFHMMRLAQARLGAQDRATASLSVAHELHLYDNEGFLLLPYYAHGTLLDVVNGFRAEAGGAMDEVLAMWLAVELLRTVEALHAKGVVHGDIKADNCLLRLDSGAAPASSWRADGSNGWAGRGLVLIDFGRAIDMRAFAPQVEFVADWKTGANDCAEMREGRPWTWQIDYYGLAGTLHCLLFGRYMDTLRCDDGGLGRTGRRYRIRDALKRYWQTQLWADCFDMLLNPVAHAAVPGNEERAAMPLLLSMRRVRERMERWLEQNCERGLGLRALLAKVEAQARSRR
ncbi:hypothetical protein CDD81_5566 [Ophiocordyceps australis]|uniref:Protein kinase domain-containing protein n=1 Tax=Ophiocordyceps australis TaxID=1399860 RepID=A0A2C5Y9R0_9HYPO|nr:hypothetical protein CDD81_5566 [Ophiocordyceps australis]